MSGSAASTATEPPLKLLHVARALGGTSGDGWWSWDRLLDHAVVLYWQNRPNIRPSCGSQPGYRAHEFRGEKTCEPCRVAHRLVKQIARARRERGLSPFGGRPDLKPCGTHAAFVRHKARGEPIDEACDAAETAFHHTRYLTRKQGANGVHSLPAGESDSELRKDTA